MGVLIAVVKWGGGVSFYANKMQQIRRLLTNIVTGETKIIFPSLKKSYLIWFVRLFRYKSKRGTLKWKLQPVVIIRLPKLWFVYLSKTP